MGITKYDWIRKEVILIVIGMFALVAVIALFGIADKVCSAEEAQCQPWKIQVYFDAGERGDGAVMWSTLSPYQERYGSVEELQAMLDYAARQYVSHRIDEMRVAPVPNVNCNYHVLVRLITMFEQYIMVEHILYHVEMDKYGILRVSIEREAKPKIEERTRA